MKSIIELAAEYFGVTVAKLKSRDRHEPLSTFRMVAVAVDYEKHGCSKAAEDFGYANHSSPINAAKLIHTRAEALPFVARDVENLRRLAEGLPPLDRMEYPAADDRGHRFPRQHSCECGRDYIAANKNEYKNGCPRCREFQACHDRRTMQQNRRPWTYVEPFSVSLPSRNPAFA